MARKVRVEYPGAIHHAINRGDRREEIFQDAADRQLFLASLGEACAKTAWQVHAWCLMPNHFHLFVETPRGNLVAGMKWAETEREQAERQGAKGFATVGVDPGRLGDSSQRASRESEAGVAVARGEDEDDAMDRRAAPDGDVDACEPSALLAPA